MGLLLLFTALAVVPAFADRHEAIVAGSEEEIFGTIWDSENEDNKMTENGAGKYVKSYTVTKSYERVLLKVVYDAIWYGDDDGDNIEFALSGAGKFTVTFDPASKEISVTGSIVTAPKTSYDHVYAVGNGEYNWLNGIAWDPSAADNEMTQVADKVWEIVYEDVYASLDYQVKFAVNGTWAVNFGGEDYDTSESGVTYDAKYDGNNIYFDVDEDGSTVKLRLDLTGYNESTHKGAKYTVTVTPPEDGDILAVKGVSDFCPDVPAQMIEVGNHVIMTFTAPKALSIGYFSWKMHFDQNKLELKGISTFDGGDIELDVTGYYIAYATVETTGEPFVLAEGDEIVSFVFTAKAAGETSVEFVATDEKAGTVNMIEIIGFKPPVAGKKAGDLLNVTVPEDAGYYISQCMWFNADNYQALSNDDIFMEGVKYYLAFYVGAKYGYKFASGAGYYFDDTQKYVDLTFSENDSTSALIYSIDIEAKSGSVLYGDVNGDNTVNKKDSLALKKYLADNSYVIDMEAADVYRDNKINKKDSLRLKQYLAGWDVKLGET